MRRVAWLAVLLLLGGSGVAARAAELEIQIIYDDTSAVAGIEPHYGFSALVDFRGQRILFDSGSDADLFLRNLTRLGIDPASITHAVISHRHSDHRNGIYRLALRNRTMEVYFLDTFPASVFEVAIAVGMNPRRVTGPVEIAPGVYSTGIVEGEPPEQALVVETSGGLVVLVGSAHPGVARMVETAEQQRGADSVRLLLGGFHMMRKQEEEIRAELERLKALGVEKVAPAHCTGERAKRLFRRAYGAMYVPTGAGRRIELE